MLKSIHIGLERFDHFRSLNKVVELVLKLTYIIYLLNMVLDKWFEVLKCNCLSILSCLPNESTS